MKKNHDREVIRIHDCWPSRYEPESSKDKATWTLFEERPYCVELAKYISSKNAWTEAFAEKKDGTLWCFKRRCDASRWARINFPGLEIEHWWTI